MEQAKPKESRYKLMFIQCASCGAVVGVTEYWNIPTLLGNIARHLGVRDIYTGG